MAFLVANWSRNTTSANEPITTLASAVVVGCFREYLYSTADTQATVAASGYFNAGTAYAGVYADVVTGDYVKVYSTTDGTLMTYRLTNSSGVITSSLVPDSGFVRGTLSLTAAQFIAGYATPIVALAAPGANRMYTDVSAQFAMTYGSAQFTTGGALGLQYGNTANLAGTKATGTIAGATVNGIAASSVFALIPAAVTATATASIVNQGIYLSNDTAAFAVGTGATFVIQVNARVVPTA